MALIVYSGGLDSTVLLHKLAAENRADGALWVNYGQRHARELECAKFNCEKLGVKLDIADLSALQPLFGDNALTQKSVEVPEGGYADENMKTTVVPNRNMILVAVAAARAIAIGTDSVAYAAHSGDHAIYPDCQETNSPTPSTASCASATTSRLGSNAPFVDMTKADIVKLGAELGVDFARTWSCYKGGKFHCGKCGTCTERREAFELAGVPDPTVYE